MNIGNFIYSMYTTSPEFIEMNFILIHEEKFVIKGRAKVNKDPGVITLSGDLKDFNANIFKNKNSNIISINANDIPLYYSCELNEFPIENRKSDIANKDIIISFPKVKIGSNFSLNISQDNNKFECEMIPLYVTNESNPLLCNLYLYQM